MNSRFRQRVASLVSSVLFLGFLWILFKKVIIVTWISMPWWALILLLIVLFFFIETMVARSIGATEPSDRAAERMKNSVAAASDAATSAGQDSLDAVKRRLDEFDKRTPS